MVEKAGHKKALVTARNEWINEGRPKASNDDDDELGIGAVNINEDDDLYDATPRGARRFVNMLRDAPVPPAPLPANDDMPDDDDLEALMAEAESMDRGKLLTVTTGTAAATAAKQNTTTTTTTTTSANGPEADDDDDYLEALIAEAEAQDEQQPAQKRAGEGSALGDQGHDFADEEEAMREMDDLW